MSVAQIVNLRPLISGHPDATGGGAKNVLSSKESVRIFRGSCLIGCLLCFWNFSAMELCPCVLGSHHIIKRDVTLTSTPSQSSFGSLRTSNNRNRLLCYNCCQKITQATFKNSSVVRTFKEVATVACPQALFFLSSQITRGAWAWEGLLWHFAWMAILRSLTFVSTCPTPTWPPHSFAYQLPFLILLLSLSLCYLLMHSLSSFHTDT